MRGGDIYGEERKKAAERVGSAYKLPWPAHMCLVCMLVGWTSTICLLSELGS